MAETCETCRFYERCEEDGQGGWCRRRSPVVGDIYSGAMWPPVDADDWCGEYQSAEIVKQDEALKEQFGKFMGKSNA